MTIKLKDRLALGPFNLSKSFSITLWSLNLFLVGCSSL